MPEYPVTEVEDVLTALVTVAMSALTMVADAPPESVIVTLPLLKSIPVSNTKLSPASVEELSEPFKTISSKLTSSFSNNNPPLLSLPSESVPSKIILGSMVAKSCENEEASDISLLSALVDELSVPSKRT